jgi:hypothetical protein
MNKITESSLELAAQCWCDEDTSSIEMNSRLAVAFAKRLDAKDKRIAELEKELEEAKVICDAVAHIGVDFGYGAYELEDDFIRKARLILEPVKETK